jgi:hypothetical protein
LKGSAGRASAEDDAFFGESAGRECEGYGKGTKGNEPDFKGTVHGVSSLAGK